MEEDFDMEKAQNPMKMVDDLKAFLESVNQQELLLSTPK